MTRNFFLTCDPLTAERLSWITDVLKFYCAHLHPESLHHHPRKTTPAFSFFLTGDALYSLVDKRCLHYWDLLFLLPPFRCVYDSRELALRGISLEPQKIKFSDQLIPGETPGIPKGAESGGDPFWDRLLKTCRDDETDSPVAGFLQLESPYMHRSSVYALRFLEAAVRAGVSPDLYTYLDGIHLGHANQDPSEFENIGKGLTAVHESAAKKGLHSLQLACSRCAVARGYRAFENSQGEVISNCTIPPFRIRNLNEIVARFERDHLIASRGAFTIRFPKEENPIPAGQSSGKRQPAPIVILITRSPYESEMAFGGLSFAIACAFRKIPVRVVFIEDGVYALAGSHQLREDETIFNIQDIIRMSTTVTPPVETYVYHPSFQHRGITKHGTLSGILAIGSRDLAKLLLMPPARSKAQFQRVILF